MNFDTAMKPDFTAQNALNRQNSTDGANTTWPPNDSPVFRYGDQFDGPGPLAAGLGVAVIESAVQYRAPQYAPDHPLAEDDSHAFSPLQAGSWRLGRSARRADGGAFPTAMPTLRQPTRTIPVLSSDIGAAPALSHAVARYLRAMAQPGCPGSRFELKALAHVAGNFGRSDLAGSSRRIIIYCDVAGDAYRCGWDSHPQSPASSQCIPLLWADWCHYQVLGLMRPRRWPEQLPKATAHPIETGSRGDCLFTCVAYALTGRVQDYDLAAILRQRTVALMTAYPRFRTLSDSRGATIEFLDTFLASREEDLRPTRTPTPIPNAAAHGAEAAAVDGEDEAGLIEALAPLSPMSGDRLTRVDEEEEDHGEASSDAGSAQPSSLPRSC